MPRPTRPGRHDADWTPADYAASANLKELWNQKARALNLSQNKVAKRWGWSQPAVSYYLNGLLRLNTDAVFQFAISLDIDPTAIDPRLAAFMKSKPPKLTRRHTVTLTTNDYTPRLCQGDAITIDHDHPATINTLSITCTTPIQIGYLTDHNTLLHPVTKQEYPIAANCRAHPIHSIHPTLNPCP